MNNLTDAANYLDIKIGKEGSVERAAFKDDAYAYYFGEVLKKRRKQRPYISRIENGEDVRISNLVQIAKALGLSFELKEV